MCIFVVPVKVGHTRASPASEEKRTISKNSNPESVHNDKAVPPMCFFLYTLPQRGPRVHLKRLSTRIDVIVETAAAWSVPWKL
jgi:hypothetical protein